MLVYQCQEIDYMYMRPGSRDLGLDTLQRPWGPASMDDELNDGLIRDLLPAWDTGSAARAAV